jgi:hypothetical protein
MLIFAVALVVLLGVLLFASAEVEAQQLGADALAQPAEGTAGSITGPVAQPAGGVNESVGTTPGGGSEPAGVEPLAGGDSGTSGGPQGSNGLAGPDSHTYGGGGATEPVDQTPSGSTVEPVGNTLEGAVEPVEQTAGGATRPVEEPVGKALGDVTRPAGRTLGTVTESTDQALKGVTEPVGETVRGATEPFDETVGGVVEPAKRAAAPILQPVDETLGEAAKPLEEVVGPVGESVTPVLETVDEVAGPVMDQPSEVTTPVLEPDIEKVDPAVRPARTALDPVAESTPTMSGVEPRDPAVTAPGPASAPVSGVARPRFEETVIKTGGDSLAQAVHDLAYQELVSAPDRARGASIPSPGVGLSPTAVEHFESSYWLAREDRHPGATEFSYYGLLDRSLRSLDGGYPTVVGPRGTESALDEVPRSPFNGALPGTGSSVLSGSGGGAFLLGILALLLILLQGGRLFWPPTGFLEPKSALHLVPVRPG